MTAEAGKGIRRSQDRCRLAGTMLLGAPSLIAEAVRLRATKQAGPKACQRLGPRKEQV
jgi:hypothetical protein